MTRRPLARRVAATAVGVLWLLAAAAPAAQAHPLGNFSINHYTGFTLRPDRVDVLAVTDTAEIPTLQAAPDVDRDGDGRQSAAERSAWAAARCAETARKLKVTTPRRLAWTRSSATFAYRPGQAGLRTSRLECRLHAPLDLTGGPVTLHVATGADTTRVGWNEITAAGRGTHLRDSSAPMASASDELRHYPRDLLATPRGDTTAHFTAVAGAGVSTTGGAGPSVRAGTGPAARVEALSRHLTSLAGARRLTVPVGLLAVLLSVVLGAGHALLPGHGKTVMAAYLAGRRGRTRDAVTVGATVTATHTAGVLVIGLCLTTFSSLAGDTVLNWLAVASGALVAVVGAGLLRDAVRRARGARRSGGARPVPGIAATETDALQPALVGAHGLAQAAHPTAPDSEARPPAHDHGPESEHSHEHGYGHDSPERRPHHEHPPEPHPHARPHDSGPGHDHDHAPGHADGAAHEHAHHHDHDEHAHHHSHDHDGAPETPHRHGLFGHHHTHAPPPAGAQPFTTRGLVGLGIAGGLVPSPSALVVLLGAIALGRTAFGAGLVLAYGLGMAATLTAVGLLLVRLGGRLSALADRPLFALVRRVAPHTALLTALLVLVVGLGLMARSLPTLL